MTSSLSTNTYYNQTNLCIHLQKMKPSFFTNLPSEIIPNILSRLSVRSIAISKCVCKAWRNLLVTDDFIDSHLSKSAPSLAVMMSMPDAYRCKVFELEDELDLRHGYGPLTEFDFPDEATIEGSANGLLFLHNLDADFDIFYVCNPATREFCELLSLPQGIAYGFGASKITGQHKVVCISPKLDCHVYTLGTGSWRRVEATTASFDYSYSIFGTFVNGNLHWIVSSDSNDTERICCFDVENECFSTFPAPPPLRDCRLDSRRRLFALRDCLCFCDESCYNEIAIWLMKETWCMDRVIRVTPYYGMYGFAYVQPIEVFGNGDILMLCDAKIFMYYTNKTQTAREIGAFFGAKKNCITSTMLLTPTLVSLKSLGMKNVISF
ncbi:F-box protein CPR1-like [Salvia hispanica]|uniref:F-box protein CPR1-like n=1 Tax=Salvia hispanica TaxID=49212 RepID=UPI00200915C0|nr:F-box protein CPR1-like [Salvia hispanica]